jgi:hypothetical protein
MVISWSAIRSQFLFSAKSETCNILRFKTVHLNYHHEKLLNMILCKKFHLTGFHRKLSRSQKISRNSSN